MLDRVAIVLQRHALPRRPAQLVDQRRLGRRDPERRRERLARQTEAIGLAVVRGAEHDEDPIVVAVGLGSAR